MAAVQRQQPVELGEVRHFDLSRPQTAQVQPTAGGMGLRPMVWRLAHAIVGHPGGIDLDAVTPAPLGHLLSQHGLAGG